MAPNAPPGNVSPANWEIPPDTEVSPRSEVCEGILDLPDADAGVVVLDLFGDICSSETPVGVCGGDGGDRERTAAVAPAYEGGQSQPR